MTVLHSVMLTQFETAAGTAQTHDHLTVCGCKSPQSRMETLQGTMSVDLLTCVSGLCRYASSQKLC